MKHLALMSAASAAALCAGLETRDEADDDPLAQATRAVEELRTANEAFRTEQTQAAERHTTEVRGLTDRIAGLETRLNRPGGGGQQQPSGPTIEQRAFEGYVRRGREALAADETRALRVSDSTAGGYLAPEQFEAEIIRGLVAVSPVRQAARVTNTSASSVIMPKRTGRITAKWVGETETRPGTEPTFGQLEIPVNEMACWIDVSNQLLEDAAVDIEAELRFDFAEEFGRLEGAAFVNGDGVKKPVGIMFDDTVPVVNSGAAASITPDSLITLLYSLPVAYRNRGAWLMNGSTIAAMRKFKDAGNNYLWVDGTYSLAGATPPTFLGRPVVEAPDMPDIAANAFPIAFGDLGSAYRIIDRVGLSVLRDPYTQATNGLTRFHARRRVGGGVVRADAIRKLKIAA